MKLTQRRSRAKLVSRYSEATRRALSSLRQKYPRLAGIMVQGSVARGEPGPFSDIDLLGVTYTRTKPNEFYYYDHDIYVPVAFVCIADLEKEFKDPKQFFWARGSAQSSTRILYDPKGILGRFMFRWKRAKPSRQILENALLEEYHHIIEYSGKLRNGWLRGDEYQTRYAARVIAQHVENAIIALNDLSPVSENVIWHQVLSAKKRPRHFRTDYPISLGIVGTSDTSKVFKSATRLLGETLRLVRHEFGARAGQNRFKRLLKEPLEKRGL